MSELLAISARNQFKGTVKEITTGLVNSEVVLDIGKGASIAAIITNKSVSFLDLESGKTAYAFFKASHVIISRELELRTSARNNFPGKIKAVTKGAVNSEVQIELESGQIITGIITNQSCDRLELAPGIQVTGLVKAFHVIIGVM
ncbi:MAG: TOBE domain-containing protein [Deltaproteobacteria bacterium]|jgi:molybdate transport system regulatory protein|nr:TOBE domain-containing protein [Deltaproteobacteria bacterium]